MLPSVESILLFTGGGGACGRLEKDGALENYRCTFISGGRLEIDKDLSNVEK